MPRVKIKVERGNGLQQVVVIDTEATRGATIGTNVYNADGTLYVPGSGGSTSANIRNGYGILISGTNPKTISVNRAANFVWQGTHEFQNTVAVNISGGGQWDINTERTYQTVPAQIYQPIADSSTAQFLSLTNNNAGATDNSRLQFSAAVGAAGLNLGWQFGIWADVPGAPLTPPDTPGTGFRWVNALSVANQPDWVFYSHNGTSNGTEVYRHRYSNAQMRFVAGSAAAPTVAFDSFTNGFYWDSVNSRLSTAIGGTGSFGVAATHIRTPNPIWASAGTAAAPAYTYFGDANNGYFYVTTDTIAESTNSTERRRINASGAWGLAGANYGTANTQAIVSGGSGAAPTWQTVLVDGQTQTISGVRTWQNQQTFSNGILITGVVGALGTSRVFMDFASGNGRFGALGPNTTDLPGFRCYLFSSDASVAKRLLEASVSGGGITTQYYGNTTDNPNHEFYGDLVLASTTVATGATAGGDTLPANPAGFLVVTINGTARKIPYYVT